MMKVLRNSFLLHQVLKSRWVLVFVMLFLSSVTTAEISQSDIAHMPVKEITVFKDGHAYVLHEGDMPTNDKGEVVLDYLPNPIIGTFWPYSSDPGIKLSCVVSGTRQVDVHRDASSIEELINSNIGSKVLVNEHSCPPYEATIVRVSGPIAMLKMHGGVKAVQIDQIRELTFIEDYQPGIDEQQSRALMTLKLDWQGQPIREKASVGMVYVQRGVRWIPSYRFELDDDGNVTVKLQATLVNELTDLEDVTTHLVVGVPTFLFKDTPDPFSLQKTFAQLSNAFATPNQTAYAFSNAIMSQSCRMGEVRYPVTPGGSSAANPADLGPELAECNKNEDLFVYSIEHITLKKGECMVVPVAEFTLEYRDVYTLDLPFLPPIEARRNFNNQQQAELAKLFHSPKAMHGIRFTNDSDYPITTAPVLILKNGRVIAQGMTRYTARGASGDVELTAAVDIKVENKDEVINSNPKTEHWDGLTYRRIDLTGRVNITSYSPKTIELEIKRSVFGGIDSADRARAITHLGPNAMNWTTDWCPAWWGWYNWPWWWYRFNQFGQIQWTVELEPNQSIDLNYTWHYYWHY